MASTLYIEDAVVTGELLGQRHASEEEVRVGEAAIVTPTGWDYLRQKRLQLSRGAVSSTSVAEPLAPAANLVAEAQVSKIEGVGRCEQPNRSCGCHDEEFGSGYVEPSSCRDCAIYELKKSGDQGANCHGCNRRTLLDQLIESGQGVDPEQLIHEVTALVVHRLED
ncbi:MAG: hypothetical protein ACKVJG_19495 [Candidatus Latescibacterota bacterium]|jgi:hypothetical protein|tara:strand:+ start:291 stop:788 length:498 start_codon:yes stop_codon:yes gene_type:complete